MLFPLFRPQPALCALILGVFTAPDGQAGQVFWILNPAGDHRQSDGQVLTARTKFQLGVFRAGFTPTPANMGEWAAHWRCWSEILFDSGTGGFSREVLFDVNPAPFLENTRLYCWGWVPGSSTQSEYFLATDADWTVPGTDPLAFPVDVNPEIADTVIVGSNDPAAGSIRSAAVSSGACPPFLYADWRRAQFPSPARDDDAISGPEADPDHDGRSNLLEYLSGTLPGSSPDFLPLLHIAAAENAGSVELQFSSPASARAEWTFESSTGLSDWKPEGVPPVYDPAAGIWRLVLPVPAGESARAFQRLRVISAINP